jgi:hypothetical protein
MYWLRAPLPGRLFSGTGFLHRAGRLAAGAGITVPDDRIDGLMANAAAANMLEDFDLLVCIQFSVQKVDKVFEAALAHGLLREQYCDCPKPSGTPLLRSGN